MKQAVLLLAHGAPERVEDVESYLSFVRGGRPLAPQIVAEIRQRYADIGGSSPLLRWTRVQAEALQHTLGLPVYFGMRNWHPFIKETVAQMKADDIHRVAALSMAPQYSDMSVGLYIRRTEEAAREAGFDAQFVWAKSFHAHPRLIDAFAERLRPLADSRKVLFTAHSLPERILQSGDPYDSEARATAAAVAAQLQLPDWDFAYQSQGMTNEKWLGPTVESRIDEYASQAVPEIVVDPIGFVCDHVEVLYDIDILFRRYAEERGIRLLRPESLNGSPKLTAALAGVVAQCLV